MPSLALLIHLADEGQGPVLLPALQRACAWGEYLESHARRIYAPALSPAAGSAQALADRLRKGDLKNGFTLRDVYRNQWQSLASREEAQEAVELLEYFDWLEAVKDKKKAGGRSTIYYLVNPRIGEGA